MGIVIAVVLGLVAGEVIRRRLNRLAYRLVPQDAGGEEPVAAQTSREADAVGFRGHSVPAGVPAARGDTAGPGLNGGQASAPPDDDVVDETALAPPGARWWIPVVLAAAWGCAVWLCPVGTGAAMTSVGQWARLLGWLAFAAIGIWLAAVDLDVRRLPDRGQMLLAGVCVVCGALAMWDHPARLLVGLGAGIGCGLGFLLIHMLSRGGLGLGDVKLIVTCGWWLGLISLTSVFAGVVAACVLAVAYSIVSRNRQFAFGPWLVAGTMIAGLMV